jgi:adenine-specific DNA-methyltransferase
MTKTENVNIGEAKGRPMLHWVGKRPLDYVTAYPAQKVEVFNPTGEENAAQGMLFHGDNKDVLAWLLANGYRGKVDLVYIDPPFDSGADYVRRVSLRGKRRIKLEGERYTLGEQVQYTDIWTNDTYLQFMYERLLLLKELLTSEGSIYLHSDWHQGHRLRCIMDEVFGAENFINEIVWKRSDAHSDAGQGAQHLGAIHDTILLYSKSPDYKWNEVYLPLPKSTVENWYNNVEEETGRLFNKADITGPGGAAKGNPVYEWNGITRAWRFSRERMAELDRAGRIYYSSSGMPYLKRYLDESKGVSLQDWWDDIQMVRGIQRRSASHYPTEKPEDLVKRVVRISSNPGDLVLDCFVGSGTTAAVAQKLGRRWIASDINKGAVQTTSKRLQIIIQKQNEERTEPHQPTLDLNEGEEAPPPAALSFTVYRVNDYDLQIQHNEAVNLVREHIGIDPLKTDPFFDGTLGKQLVKIVPFNHPVTPLDLQLVKDEIALRPEEERDVVVVALGKELAVDEWLEEYNRHRPVNNIELIELRTDEKYGNFLVHQPAEAQVRIERQDGELLVEIEDFISPTIAQRLEMDTPLLKVKIPDWRAMVDVVLIDTDYDGEVFDIDLSDVPERKDDLVAGEYTLEAPEGETTVAVKIIDMLGEEVLVTETV